jgi:restriction system protein
VNDIALPVQIGDYVVFPSKLDRQINIGTIESDYIYNANATEYVQKREVNGFNSIE